MQRGVVNEPRVLVMTKVPNDLPLYLFLPHVLGVIKKWMQGRRSREFSLLKCWIAEREEDARDVVR